MKTLIENAIIVSDGRSFSGTIVIENDRISEITDKQTTALWHADQTVDATGCFVLPGIIDDHVHFREPGLTRKADIESESRAAAWGGVTSFFDMPNTVPQTTTPEALDEKFALARQKSHVNYSFSTLTAFPASSSSWAVAPATCWWTVQMPSALFSVRPDCL